MSTPTAAPDRASAIIADAIAAARAFTERIGAPSIDRTYQIGRLEVEIKGLCRELDAARSAAGIAEAIAALPSEHAGMSAVLQALYERMDAEAGTLGSHGFDTVAAYLEDACFTMSECTWSDADELARIEREVRATFDSVEHEDRRFNERDERDERRDNAYKRLGRRE